MGASFVWIYLRILPALLAQVLGVEILERSGGRCDLG